MSHRYSIFFTAVCLLLAGCFGANRDAVDGSEIRNEYSIKNSPYNRIKENYISFWIYDDEGRYINSEKRMDIYDDKLVLESRDLDDDGNVLASKKIEIPESDDVLNLWRQLQEYKGGEKCDFASIEVLYWGVDGERFSMSIGRKGCPNRMFVDSFNKYWADAFATEEPVE